MEIKNLTLLLLLFSCSDKNTSSTLPEYVTTPTGLQYKILEKGSGMAAKAGDTVFIFETTSYLDGTILYSNENTTSPVRVVIGANQATEAVDEGLRGMQIGEIRELIATPNLVKRTSYPPNVSPDSALRIRIIMHEIQ